MTADGEENVQCLRFNEHKQRHASMEEREAYVRHDLGRMYISKTIVELPDDTDLDVEVDDPGDTPDHEKKSKQLKPPWEARSK
jgi:hypothetical protein